MGSAPKMLGILHNAGMARKARKGRAGKQGRRWTEAEARSVLAKLESSGQPLSRFAREQGLTAQRLYWWKARLGKSERGVRRKRVEAPRLAPVVLTGIGSGASAAIIRVGRVEFEVIDPERVSGQWLRELAEALVGVS